MIKALIEIRVKQIYRAFYGIGLIRFIFLFLFVAFALTGLFFASQKNENAYYIIGVFFFILILIQIKRKDKFFLQTNFSKYRLIFQVEYFLLSLPLIIILLLNFKWQVLSIMIAGSFLISQLNYAPQKRDFNTFLQRIIPDEMYEWKAGSRKLMFIIVPLWIIGLATSFFIGSLPAVIFIIGISLLNLYEICEPYQMIIATEKSASKFLNRKIQLHILVLTLILLPLVIVFILFHKEYWYIAIAEYFLFISIHIYFILIKYAYYEPNKKPVSIQIMNILGSISVIIPLLLPVIWLLSGIFYFNALKTLNYYLHDFH